MPGASISRPESPLLLARVAGIFYIGTIAGNIFAELIRKKLIVSGDAAATAHNILASEPLYRSAFTANLFAGASYVVVTLLLYELLRPVNKTISLLAAFFGLMVVAVASVGSVAGLGPLFLLSDANYLRAFPPAQLQALAYVFHRLDAQGTLVSLVFFGLYCSFIGYLMFRSSFFPRVLGMLMVLAGLCYLIYTTASFLSPPLAARLSTFILYPCILGKAALALWLVVFGVNAEKWFAAEFETSSSRGGLVG